MSGTAISQSMTWRIRKFRVPAVQRKVASLSHDGDNDPCLRKKARACGLAGPHAASLSGSSPSPCPVEACGVAKPGAQVSALLPKPDVLGTKSLVLGLELFDA